MHISLRIIFFPWKTRGNCVCVARIFNTFIASVSSTYCFEKWFQISWNLQIKSFLLVNTRKKCGRILKSCCFFSSKKAKCEEVNLCCTRVRGYEKFSAFLFEEIFEREIWQKLVVFFLLKICLKIHFSSIYLIQRFLKRDFYYCTCLFKDLYRFSELSPERRNSTSLKKNAFQY